MWILLFHFWGTGAYACGVDVLMCHAMFALHRIETYWMHAECCVAFLSVSQHGDECSHWQENQSSLCGAASCWAGQPLSLSFSHFINMQLSTTYKTHTILTLNLPCQHQTSLCFCLRLNKIYSDRHTFKTSQFVFHHSQHVFPLLFSLPCNGKKQHKDTFYRDGNENLIL